MTDDWEIQLETVPRPSFLGGKTTRVREYLTKKNGALLKFESGGLQEWYYVYKDKYCGTTLDTAVNVSYAPYKGETLRQIGLQRAFRDLVSLKPLTELEAIKAVAYLSATIGAGINMLEGKEEKYSYSIAGWEILLTSKNMRAGGASI